MKERSKYWDIVKGIGIVSIVLGHSCFFGVKWVYAYHMMLFFFVSGYFFSDKKYQNRPFEYLGKKIGDFSPKFIIYQSMLVVFTNVFVSMGIYGEVPKKGIGEIVRGILNTLFFQHAPIGASAWFVPLLIVTSGLFAILLFITSAYTQDVTSKLVMRVISLIAAGGIGTWLCTRNYSLAAYGHLALLLQPVMGAGFLLKKTYFLYKPNPKPVIIIIGGLVSIGILIWLVGIENQFIDISANMIGSPLKFYLSSFSGIFLCLISAKGIELLPMVSRLFGHIGQISFEIMVFHMMSFKIVDYVYTVILKQGTFIELGKLPYSYKNLWLFYLIAGIAIPALIKFIIDKLNFIVKDRFLQFGCTCITK